MGITYTSEDGKEHEGFPASDLAEYNFRLLSLSRILKFGVLVGTIIGLGFLGFLVFVLYQIMKNDILTRVVNACV